MKFNIDVFHFSWFPQVGIFVYWVFAVILCCLPFEENSLWWKKTVGSTRLHWRILIYYKFICINANTVSSPPLDNGPRLNVTLTNAFKLTKNFYFTNVFVVNLKKCLWTLKRKFIVSLTPLPLFYYFIFSRYISIVYEYLMCLWHVLQLIELYIIQ